MRSMVEEVHATSCGPACSAALRVWVSACGWACTGVGWWVRRDVTSSPLPAHGHFNLRKVEGVCCMGFRLTQPPPCCCTWPIPCLLSIILRCTMGFGRPCHPGGESGRGDKIKLRDTP